MTHDVLTLDRTYAASPARLWTAWTTEAGLASWWWTHWPGTTYAVDLRVGGAWRIEAADHGVGVRGEYVALAPSERLESSWVWLDDGVDGDVERVQVTFEPVDVGTRVVVTHTGPWSTPQPAADYAQGWAFVLDGLAALLQRSE